MPSINSYLSLLHGLIVAIGLILYTMGAKYLPSAELTLLSLMEVVGGVIWVWIPIFGINEVPSFTCYSWWYSNNFCSFISWLWCQKKKRTSFT
jgi:multisubunit Na+/H+ antiporter MnhB subunit